MLITLSSPPFFPKASHVVANGGVFLIVGSNMIIKQTGE